MSLPNSLLPLNSHLQKKQPNLRAAVTSLPKVWMLALPFHQLPKHFDGIEQPDLRAAVMSLPEVLLPQVLRHNHQVVQSHLQFLMEFCHLHHHHHILQRVRRHPRAAVVSLPGPLSQQDGNLVSW